MKNIRLAILGTLAVALLGSGLAQTVSKHLLSGDELKKAVPAEYFFRGQKAPVQVRNAGGFQLADGKMTLAALVDASGYSSAIQQKYQGLLITESKLNVGGLDLPPGQYGSGFTADGKLVVMNVANEDVLSVAFQTDSALQCLCRSRWSRMGTATSCTPERSGWGSRRSREASQTRDYCVAKGATLRATRLGPSLRKERLLGMTFDCTATRVSLLLLPESVALLKTSSISARAAGRDRAAWLLRRACAVR